MVLLAVPDVSAAMSQTVMTPLAPTPTSAQSEMSTAQFEQSLSGGFYDGDWHPSGEFIAMAGESGLTILTNDMHIISQIHAGELVRSLSWHPNGSQLALTIGNTIEIWQWDNVGQQLQLLTTLSSNLEQLGVYWSPTGERLANLEVEPVDPLWAADDSGLLAFGQIRFWNTSSWTLEHISEDHFSVNLLYSQATFLDWSPDGRYLAGSGYAYGLIDEEWRTRSGVSIYVIDANTGQRAQTISISGEPEPLSVAWHPTQNWILLGGGNGTKVYDLATSEFIGGLAVSFNNETVDWSPGGRYYTAIGGIVIDVVTGNYLGSAHSEVPIIVGRWSPDGRRLLTGRLDGLVAIEDPTSLPGFVAEIPVTPAPPSAP